MKTQMMIPRFIATLRWWLAACLLLLLVIPAQAQETLSIVIGDENEQVSGAELREWLASQTRIAYTGEEAIRIKLGLRIYESGRLSKTYTSNAHPVGTRMAAFLPRDDWFGEESDRFNPFTWLVEKFLGGGTSTPTNNWSGWPQTECDTLPPAAKRACYAANGYRGVGAATETFIMIFPMPDDREMDINTQGVILTLSE